MKLPEYRQVFAANLRRARLRLGMTQAEVGAVGAIEERHYQRLEAGESDPKLSTVFALSRLLNLSIDEITTEKAGGGSSDLRERRRPPQKPRWDVIAAARQRVAADAPKKRRRKKKGKAIKRRR